jgi:gas vesicle protein
MKSTSKFVLTVLGAAAAGAIIGLLVAPEKGTELRQRIQSAANDWTDQLTDLMNSSREKLGEVKGDLKARAESGLSEVREKM